MRTFNLSSTKREHGDSRSLPHHAKAYSVRGNWRIPAHCAPSVLGPADVFILCCLQASARRLLNSTMPYVDKGTISSLLSSSCCSDFFPEGNLQERRSLFRISLVSDIFWAILNYITLLYVVCCFPLSFLLPGGICAFLIVFFFAVSSLCSPMNKPKSTQQVKGQAALVRAMTARLVIVALLILCEVRNLSEL